jgi:hypothetical protein
VDRFGVLLKQENVQPPSNLLGRHGHSVALAMAGLPDPNQTAGPTILARCQHLHLAALRTTEFADGLRESATTAGKTWTGEAITEAIETCSGYAYIIKLVEYQSFDTGVSNELTVEDVSQVVTARTSLTFRMSTQRFTVPYQTVRLNRLTGLAFIAPVSGFAAKC